MNNIDILEELKEWFNNFDLDSIKHKPEEYIQAISTLIAENKEVKEEIEELKENNGYHLGFIDGGIAKRYEYEYKIKAKIEELKETADEDNMEDFVRIETLQSLLGKE